ncbi:MAG: hypothetical protein ACI8TP_003858 [Acidimicrobiales bacterium]|jgi:hypothetical protein
MATTTGAASRVRAAPEAVDALGDARWFERPIVALFMVFTLAMAAAQLASPSGYLTSDTGPKVATIEAMVASNTNSPFVGYWAEAEDPAGLLHPFRHSLDRVELPNGDTGYVAVTTLPMLYAAKPLVALGGIRLALLLPVGGLVAVSGAAWALARRLGSHDGVLAIWAVGLASPALIYAVDLWEHSVGLALMAWGVVWFTDAASGRGAPRWSAPAFALAGGLAFGSAATMRQEALVYGLVTGLAAALSVTRSSGFIAAVGRLAPGPFGALAALVANGALEAAMLGGGIRSGRGAATLEASTTSVTDRLLAGAITFASPGGGPAVMVLVVAALFTVSLVGIGFSLARGSDPRRFVVVAGAAYLIIALSWSMNGTNFLPGLIVVAPFAGLGLGLRPVDPAGRIAWGAAVAGLPLVMLFQHVAGAVPQWGGRYLLTSGFVLAVCAVVALERDHQRALTVAFVVSATLAGFGSAWSIERTQTFAAVGQQLAGYDEPLVFFDDFLPPEFGPVALEQSWLVAATDADRSLVNDVFRERRIDRFGFVGPDDDRAVPGFDGFAITDSRVIPILRGDEVRVTNFERVNS